MIIDGDHNYFTVASELELIGARAAGPGMPLLLLHDVGWPLGRRDSYHAPDRIPDEHRQPLARDAFLVPGDPGVGDRGLYYECVADRGGRPAQRRPHRARGLPRGQRRAALGDRRRRSSASRVVWHPKAPWAAALEAVVAPWDRNPLLERVEAKRVDHLVAEFREPAARRRPATRADYVHRYRLIGRLLPILDSGAFALAEKLSAVKQRGRPNVSRARSRGAARRARRRRHRRRAPAPPPRGLARGRGADARGRAGAGLAAGDAARGQPGPRWRGFLIRAPSRRSGSVQVQLELLQVSISLPRASFRWSSAAPIRSRAAAASASARRARRRQSGSAPASEPLRPLLGQLDVGLDPLLRVAAAGRASGGG